MNGAAPKPVWAARVADSRPTIRRSALQHIARMARTNIDSDSHHCLRPPSRRTQNGAHSLFLLWLGCARKQSNNKHTETNNVQNSGGPHSQHQGVAISPPLYGNKAELLKLSSRPEIGACGGDQGIAPVGRKPVCDPARPEVGA